MARGMSFRGMLEQAAPILRRQFGWGEIYHSRQGLGRAFEPSGLHGYFNDLTSKTRHRGLYDRDGLPLLTESRGRPFYHPVVICQWGLGHYDLFLLSGQEVHLALFTRAAEWLIRNQDPEGGWTCFDLGTARPVAAVRTGVPYGWHSATSPYSALAQGEAVSLLVRASEISRRREFSDAARAAWRLMTLPEDAGGVCSHSSRGPRFLEVPGKGNVPILNGWIFAMFGVWDFWLCTKELGALEFFDQCYVSLAMHLADFDLTWWSAYDLDGHVAKPFYHHLHVAQLSALCAIRGDAAVSAIAARWKRAATAPNASRAYLKYAYERVERLAGNQTHRS